MKKRDKIIYWITTILVGGMMIMSGVMYLTKNPEVVKGFQTLGLPMFLIDILGIAKLLGGITLLIPVPAIERVKEWAYAGIAFVFIGATWTHIATGTPFFGPLVLLTILGVSYWFRERLKAV